MASPAEERTCFEGLWAKAPTVNGFLAGAPAVKYLSCSGLSSSMLRQIWGLVDKTAPWFVDKTARLICALVLVGAAWLVLVDTRWQVRVEC